MTWGTPCAKFRLPRPFGFRVRADVRDIRQTDRQTTDADHRLMPPPPMGRGQNNGIYKCKHYTQKLFKQELCDMTHKTRVSGLKEWLT